MVFVHETRRKLKVIWLFWRALWLIWSGRRLWPTEWFNNNYFTPVFSLSAQTTWLLNCLYFTKDGFLKASSKEEVNRIQTVEPTVLRGQIGADDLFLSGLFAQFPTVVLHGDVTVRLAYFLAVLYTTQNSHWLHQTFREEWECFTPFPLFSYWFASCPKVLFCKTSFKGPGKSYPNSLKFNLKIWPSRKISSSVSCE